MTRHDVKTLRNIFPTPPCLSSIEMSGLADELLADLESEELSRKRKADDDGSEDDGDARGEEDNEDEEHPDGQENKGVEIGSLVLEGGVKPADELDAEDVQRMELGAIEDVTKVAKLEGSK